MSEAERHIRYYSARVLIDGARVLSPQFSDSILHITGAHLEMLRNLTQYLHRRSTFVGEYHDQYYLTPSDNDWDNISAIVASLEEVLMGNENTIYGYNDRWFDEIIDYKVGDAGYTVNLPAVPAGYVYVAECLCATDVQQACLQSHEIYAGGGGLVLREYDNVLAGKWKSTLLPHMTLKAGDSLAVTFVSGTSGEMLIVKVWGYKMKVP